MPTEESHSLEVGFEIQGVDENGVEVPVRPGLHLPNVVSRRGHKVKIIASVFDVPNPDAVTIVRLSNATVEVFSEHVVGGKGDLARPAQVWGVSEENGEKEVRPGDLDPDHPPTVSIIIEPDDEDDHLGQGPDYEASLDVTSQTISFLTDRAPETGNEGSTATTGGAANTGMQTFIIPFSSK